jgi:hypothetical protein
MHTKGFFEQSYEEGHVATGGTRAAWSQLGAAEWDRIRTSLIAGGHWHEGRSCSEVRCGK